MLFTLDAIDDIESRRSVPDVVSSIAAALTVCQLGVKRAELAIERK